jgi:hypothetical protein
MQQKMHNGNEYEKQYGYLSEEAIDYIFGCIIHAHTFGKGKNLLISNGQPKVKT